MTTPLFRSSRRPVNTKLLLIQRYWFMMAQQALACSPSKWTFWERKMLCAALLAQGAPSSNNDDTVGYTMTRVEAVYVVRAAEVAPKCP